MPPDREFRSKPDVSAVGNGAPKLLLALSLERGEGDYRRALGDQRVARDLFDTRGALGLVELVDLCDNYDIVYPRLVHPIKHHCVVLGDACAAVDKLYHALNKIDIFVFGKITVGQSRPFISVLGLASREAVAGQVDQKELFVDLVEVDRNSLAGVEETRARLFLPSRVLISELFPTFDLPESATCGMGSVGNCDAKPAVILRFTF